MPDPVCLTCPPFEVLETLVLGSIYREIEPLTTKIGSVLQHNSKKKRIKVSINDIEVSAQKGAIKGVDLFRKNALKGFGKMKKTFMLKKKKSSNK